MLNIIFMWLFFPLLVVKVCKDNHTLQYHFVFNLTSVDKSSDEALAL